MAGHHPSSNNLTVLDYPLNIGNQVANGEHYMMIDSYESVNALVSRPNKKSSIALYIPPNSLKTAFGASYEGLDSGATKAKMGFAEGAEELSGMSGFVEGLLKNVSKDFSAVGFKSI